MGEFALHSLNCASLVKMQIIVPKYKLQHFKTIHCNPNGCLADALNPLIGGERFDSSD